MEKTFFQKWCAKWWLYAVYALGVVMAVLLFVHWDAWTMQQRLMGVLAVLIPVHVFEEDTFPAGFYVEMNLLQRSPEPKRYPMNTVTNMFTNLVAELLVFLLTCAGPTTGMILLVCFFGIGESLVHTLMGVLMYRRFRDKGKKTIYGPGSLTAYCVMLPLSICAIVWMTGQRLTGAGIATGIGLLLFIIIGLIRLPQMISARIKSSKYEFTSYEYFEKYMGE